VLALTLFLAVSPAGAAEGEAPENGPVQQIVFSGLRRTNEAFLRKRLASRVGESFDARQAREDRERLDRLGIFSAIEVRPVYREDEVILEINVAEVMPYLPYPSLNYTEENGLSFGGGVKFLNLLGRGVSGSLSARFGGLKDFEALLESPWDPNPSFWYEVTYHYRDRPNELVGFHESVHEGDLRAGYQLHPDLRTGVVFDYMYMKSPAPGFTLSPDDSDWTPGLGVLAEYDTRDLASNPRRGWQNSIDFTQYGGFLGGDGSFARVNFDLRRYQPTAERQTLVISSLSSLQTGMVGEEIPVYRTFWVGGTNSVRGWDLGARSGKNQMINTVEYRYEILAPRAFRVFGIGLYSGIHIAAFGDLGTAWGESDEFTGNFIGGGGFGVRLLFPFIQMFRFDFGFGQHGIRPVPHFGIREKAYYQRLRVR